MEPVITVTEHGPYRVEGDITVCGIEGEVLRSGGPAYLCRCGGSRNKPFCDATHGVKGFDGTETADRGSTAQRRDTYSGGPGTVYDDRGVCAHFGQCTSRLPGVFRADREPFVDPDKAGPAEIIDVVVSCPSGALSYATGEDPRPLERDREAAITPIADGPYRVTGRVQVVSENGEAYEPRAGRRSAAAGSHVTSPSATGRTGTPGSVTRSPPPNE
jgi:CDGSH-type Zn-finger protein